MKLPVRNLTILALISGLVTVGALSGPRVQANPAANDANFALPPQETMIPIVQRMSAQDVRQRLAAIFSNDDSAAAFCKDPMPLLQELRVPIARGVRVSARIVSGENMSEIAGEGDLGDPIPKIYGVICFNIGGFSYCVYNFHKGGVHDNTPEVAFNLVRGGFPSAFDRDLSDVKSALAVVRDPRGYMARKAVRVLPTDDVSVSVAPVADPSRGATNPRWCGTLRIKMPTGSITYSNCANRVMASSEFDTELCCGLK